MDVNKDQKGMKKGARAAAGGGCKEKREDRTGVRFAETQGGARVAIGIGRT